ncbi:MAG TPA: hypothetical protein VEO37_05850 [Thermoanaerobaculia bacterium]|nr:hypothetical protein [Thermoanaerobaculia bacterium]
MLRTPDLQDLRRSHPLRLERKLLQEIPLAEKTLQLSGADVVTYPIDVNP